MINNNTEQLEEVLNVRLRALLTEYGLVEDENSDNISYARELFFKG